MKILYLIVATILSAFFYRIGGMSKEEAKQYFPWFPQVLVHGWIRDAVCSLLTLLYIICFWSHVAWGWYVGVLAAQWGFTSTYFDDAFINWDKPNDNFYLHGLFIGLASLFVGIPAGMWVHCLIRSVVMSLFMGILSAIATDVFIEEYGRGASIQATLIL